MHRGPARFDFSVHPASFEKPPLEELEEEEDVEPPSVGVVPLLLLEELLLDELEVPPSVFVAS